MPSSEQTVDSITVDSNELLTFHLAGGISLPEKIREKGRNRQISRRMDTHGIIVVERFATFHYY